MHEPDLTFADTRFWAPRRGWDTVRILMLARGIVSGPSGRIDTVDIERL